jgi:hypothetical protein
MTQSLYMQLYIWVVGELCLRMTLMPKSYIGRRNQPKFPPSVMGKVGTRKWKDNAFESDCLLWIALQQNFRAIMKRDVVFGYRNSFIENVQKRDAALCRRGQSRPG